MFFPRSIRQTTPGGLPPAGISYADEAAAHHGLRGDLTEIQREALQKAEAIEARITRRAVASADPTPAEATERRLMRCRPSPATDEVTDEMRAEAARWRDRAEAAPEDAAERERIVRAAEFELALRRATRSARGVMAEIEQNKRTIARALAARQLRRRALRLSTPYLASEMDRFDRENLWPLFWEYSYSPNWKRRVRLARILFKNEIASGGPSR